MNQIKLFFLSPYLAMGVVLLMYGVKVASKLSIGRWIHSPMIEGDGWHNVADIGEACVVIATIWFSRLPPSDTFPLGRKNIESIFSVAVSVLLAIMAFKISGTAVISLWNIAHGQVAPLVMSPEVVVWVMGITLGSALVSGIVSTYQIKVGKRTGHASLVADGKETLSDGLIEITIFLGIVGEYILDAPWLEYPFALIVSVVMVRTAREIGARGLAALLQKSIGIHHERAIKAIVADMYGVASVAQIKTFMVGSAVILIMKVLSRTSTEMSRLLKESMALQIAQYLRQEGFVDGEFFIRFDVPDSDAHRRTVALVCDHRSWRVAHSIQEATHVAISDIAFGEVGRTVLHAVAHKETGEETEEALLALLEEQHVRELVLFAFDRAWNGMHTPSGVWILNGGSENPSVYGLPKV